MNWNNIKLPSSFKQLNLTAKGPVSSLKQDRPVLQNKN